MICGETSSTGGLHAHTSTVLYGLYVRVVVNQPIVVAEITSLARPKPFRFQSRDGLSIHGYATAPPGAEVALPTVMLVHGGPWTRDNWVFHLEAQWLANRGYLVLQVNFRGSTGYGKHFRNAGNKAWGTWMQHDLEDAVQHACDRGWTDPKRVGIFGASYGGYAALCGVAFAPSLYRCAVSSCGPANLLTLLDSLPAYWHGTRSLMLGRVGDPDGEAGLLWQHSPLSRVDAITAPLLLAHGLKDPRVKAAEVEQLLAALRRNGVHHQHLRFDDEGHALLKPKNREVFYATAERFLATHLGGRCE